MRPYARSTMGAVYQEPKKIPILPFGGSALQKRHMGGRDRSSSLGAPIAWTWMSRGSIHSSSRLTSSPFPPPSTPPDSRTMGKSARSITRCCAPSRAERSFGSSFS